jgi:hypothetical protein
VYGESILPVKAVLMEGFMFPVITAKMFEEKGGQIVDGTLGNLALSDKQYQVDFKGYRAMPGENAWSNSGVSNAITRYMFVAQQAIQMAHTSVEKPFGNGPMNMTLTARRTTNTAAIYPGSFFKLNIAPNPDPATNTRGPTRLLLCTERAEDGPSVKLTGTDWGIAFVSLPPAALGTPAQLTGDPGHSATCAVTLNALAEPAEVWINATPTSVGVRPPDNDPNWMFVAYNWVNWVAVARSLPGGTRIWWRGRTTPRRLSHISGVDLGIKGDKLTSGWVYASAPGYVDLSTLSAPTGLTASSITANSFRVTWANPDATRQVEVWLATPTTDPRTRIAVLAPGSTLYDFRGLGASKTYRVGIRAIDGAGGYAEATIDVTTTALAPFIPQPFNNRGGKLLV